MMIQKCLLSLLMLSVTASPFAVSANDVLPVEKALRMLLTYSVNEEKGRENYPGGELVETGSLAGYLPVVIDSAPYHLVALPTRTMKYRSKYATTVELKDIAGSDRAVMTPAVAESWVKIGLKGRYDYRISTTEEWFFASRITGLPRLGPMLVTLVSDKPFNDLLNPSAPQGQKITTAKAQQ